VVSANGVPNHKTGFIFYLPKIHQSGLHLSNPVVFLPKVLDFLNLTIQELEWKYFQSGSGLIFQNMAENQMQSEPA
jgi:hypothetical protein